MHRLSDFLDYLDERRDVLRKAEKALCSLQEKYETHFQEIQRVRERELQQLQAAILADRSAVPAGLLAELDVAQTDAEAAFEERLAELRTRQKKLSRSAQNRRSRSKRAEQKVREENVSLDQEEEALKTRNAKLLADIADYNRRIRELGKGVGFFLNVFKMRALEAERRAIDAEQADVAARIDGLRHRWGRIDVAHGSQEHEMREQWVKLTADAAAVQTKIDYLEAARERIVRRSALEQVLFARQLPDAEDRGGKGEDPACPRCARPHPPTHHFCRFCAQRLVEDRPDLAGSLDEVAELNHHHARFSEGMQACQEIIGLVRGLKSGVEAFRESVADVRASEKKHPLPKLQIDVPVPSVTFGRIFDTLADAAQPARALHPRPYAAEIRKIIGETLTEKKIKRYFEGMGEELSRCADAQW